MFGTKKENGKMKQQKSTSGSASGINSLVLGTTVKGEIFAENDIRIDGIVSGKIECKGKLILGPKAKVDGEIYCQNAVIDGTFKGKLKVDELLIVRETAVINGDVFTEQLNVDSGAIFNVNCVMGGQKIKTIKDTLAK